MKLLNALPLASEFYPCRRLLHPVQFIENFRVAAECPNGAPQRTPAACTRILPLGVRARKKSASHPPVIDPTTLANCTKMVAVNPATAKPMWN